jgi:hypothetical protein
MLPPLVLVIIAGAGSVARLLGRIEAVPNVGRVARVAVTVALIGILIVTDALMGRQWAIAKRREARAQLLADAGAVVAREADGPCVAVATRVPIVGWYSGCLTVPFAADLGNARAKVPAGSPAYVVFVTDDPEFAAPELLDAYRRLAVEPPIDLIRQGSRTATIHLVPR